MFKVQVFDDSPDVQQWRDISVLNEEYYGYFHRWIDDVQPWEQAQAFHYGDNGRGESAPGTLADVFEVADLLWFHSDGKVRTGIRDLRSGELIYDSATPIDIRQHPLFPTLKEARWVDKFCKVASVVNSRAVPQEVVKFAESIYESHKHFDPEVVVWAIVMKEKLPLPWPRRQPSLVQQGVEPGT